MPKAQMPYPLEFPCKLVEFVRAGRTPNEPAREFEPSAESIRNWVK
jgi:transposase